MGLHSKSSAEKLGFWLTIICGVHCIATPLLITFLPILGSKFEAFHQYELIFLLASLLLAFYLMNKDFKIHQNHLPRQLIITAFIIASTCWSVFQEIYISVIVSTLIIAAYWLNWKHKEKCRCKLSH